MNKDDNVYTRPQITRTTSVLGSGALRAEARLRDLRTWQAEFYKNLPPVENSRQFKRWVARLYQKAALAKAKHDKIWNKNKNSKQGTGETVAAL
jgi:hypothetical protein